ncbi:MAG: DUF898 domain-containing protein [Nitrospirota bacterium]|nr:MAG: DUF898 domain-containing protein [Nitrospirota bacterium]
MDLAELFSEARKAYEAGELQKAYDLFHQVISDHSGTDESNYAYGYIAKIKSNRDYQIKAAPTDSEPEKAEYIPLKFNGNAKEYFRIWIVNLCLTLITAGIFSAWAKVRKKRYFYSNLDLDGSSFQYLARPIPILKGRIIAAVIFLLYYSSSHLYTGMLPYVLGAGFFISPWVIVRSSAFKARYSAFRNMTFHFRGTYWEALKVISAWGIIPALVIGTMFNWWGKIWAAGIFYLIFGIIFPWWIRRLKYFIATNTSYGGRSGKFGATGGQFFGIYFIAGLIIMGFGIVSSIGVGIAAVLSKNIELAMFFILPVYVGYVLAFAYVQANITNTVWNQIGLGPMRFESTLKSCELAKLYLTNALGIIVSLGLLIPWAVIRTLKYRADHTRVIRSGEFTEFEGSRSYSVQAAGAEVGEFFDMDLSI